jgi:magnesium chelatase subunit D
VTGAAAQPGPWADAVRAAALLAVDPAGLGGAALRAPPGAVRDAWLAAVRRALPPGAPFRRVPLNAPDERLLGGLDLAATLRDGRPVARRGLLAEADGGVVVLAMAERISALMAARLTAALDSGEILLQRDGVAIRSPARIGVVALDEGLEEERPPPALLDRLAFHLDLGAVRPGDAVAQDPCTQDPGTQDPGPGAVEAARRRLATVEAPDGAIEALAMAGASLGAHSARTLLLAIRVARAAAALAGRPEVAAEDAALAARLVLAPRALCLPATAEAEPPPAEDPQSPDAAEAGAEQGEPEPAREPPSLDEVVVAAARAAIPADLLARLLATGPTARRARSQGQAGVLQAGALRGRPAGIGRGPLRPGARLNVVETLRAAAPWQRLRRGAGAAAAGTRLAVRAEDFRTTRYRQRAQTTAIFVVDASGSAALHRLAEAKGAVEQLLADCYVRRDQVAVLAFRGRGAELLLPPTRSLVRAKRSLAGLPGGGATPLAAALDAAGALADAVRRRGATPVLVLLTDGRANLARDGTPGRERAEADALAAAAALRAAATTGLLVDTAPRPQEAARRIAAAMGARYLPLPQLDPALLSRAVRGVAAGARDSG